MTTSTVYYSNIYAFRAAGAPAPQAAASGTVTVSFARVSGTADPGAPHVAKLAAQVRALPLPNMLVLGKEPS